MPLISIYLGPLSGLFGLLYAWAARRLGPGAALAGAPFFWVSIEFARVNLFFLSMPMALLAHSQWQQILLIQATSITGA